jgi:HEPN domain-containing protein
MPRVPDENTLKEINDWVSFAEDDLKSARILLNVSDFNNYRMAAFHAQQAAEKYLKGLLTFHSVVFPYTHSIALLLELCDDHGTKWQQTLSGAEILSSYASTQRYPTKAEHVTRQEAAEAVEIAARVREAVRAKFKELGVELH